MPTLLWILAAILVIAGIVTVVRGAVLLGIVLIIVGLLVRPGGVSIFTQPVRADDRPSRSRRARRIRQRGVRHASTVHIVVDADD